MPNNATCVLSATHLSYLNTPAPWYLKQLQGVVSLSVASSDTHPKNRPHRWIQPIQIIHHMAPTMAQCNNAPFCCLPEARIASLNPLVVYIPTPNSGPHQRTTHRWEKCRCAVRGKVPATWRTTELRKL